MNVNRSTLTGPDSAKRITVFSPTPLLTVTIESSSASSPELHVHAGGQGFWVARMIARLGVSVTLCAPFGGDTGRLLRTLIADDDVQVTGIATAGSNGSYVHDRRTGERVEICSVEGAKLNRHEEDDLYNASFASALDSHLLVLTGQFPTPVVPANFYERLARDLGTNGCRVIADLSGDELDQALLGGVDILCFSHEQMIAQQIAASERIEDLIAGMESLRNRGAKHVILHRAAESSLTWIDGTLVELISPQVIPLDHRGGGDTFFAALAVGLVQQKPFEDTIRFAAAAGTLNVTRRGLGTGRIDDIAALSQYVQIRPLDRDSSS